MKRLTQRCGCGICGSNKKVILYPLYKIGGDEYMDHGLINQCFEKLAMYEDLEEQGLLLRLPCKVGDTAYYLHRAYLKNADKWVDVIDEVEVVSFVLSINIFVNVKYYVGSERIGKVLTPYKTLFFTKAEAEKALEKMKGE